MGKHRPAPKARRFLLPILTAATVIVFLAPAAQADTTLTVTKTATPAEGGTVEPGSTITYSIAIQNSGVEDATTVVLTDATPANTTYVADSATDNGTPILGAANPFAGGYAVGTITQGTTETFTFQVTVDAVADATPISNTATIDADNEAAGSTLSDSANHTVQSQPALTIDKTSSPTEGGTVTPGSTITYTVVVGNSQSATATADDVVVTDPTPANTTYVAGSATLDGNPEADAPNPGDNPFETGFDLGDMAPSDTHTITFQVVVDTPLPNATPIDNTATASATNSAVSPSDDANLTVSSMPGLTVDKTSSPAEGGPVVPGDTIAYTITVTNDVLATETATGVSLLDAVPADTTYVADSATVDSAPVAGATNPFETGYALPDMAPGDSHTLTFSVLVDTPLDNGTQIVNTATVSSDQLPDASDAATLTVQSAPELTLVKTSVPAEGGRVTPGTTIAYTVVITNAAAATEVADQLSLLDPTPANTSYVAGSGNVDGTAVTGTGNPFGTAFSLTDLNPGESHTITFSVRVNSPLSRGTVISNIARLTADNHPDVQDAASHTVDSAPVMKVTFSSDPAPGTKLEADETIRYTIVVSNDPAATEGLNSVVVQAPTPEGTTFIEGSAKLDGTTVNRAVASTSVLAPGPFPGGYALGTMAPGTSHTLVYRVRVKPSADQIRSTVTVSAANAPSVTATLTHRGPESGTGGAGGNGDGDGGGGNGSGTGGTGTTTGDGSLPFTGLDLARLLLLASTLMLAGWTLLARGRAVQRRRATGGAVDAPSTGSATVDRWVDAWFYP